MRFLPAGVVGVTVLLGVSIIAMAAPPVRAAETPDTCRSAFNCGAMSARLAGSENDYPGAFRAIRRGCDIETRTPIQGDSLFACEQYAELLISAGTARGGDPPKGIAMLEGMCKAHPPVPQSQESSPCSTLAREYNKPPKASGLARQTDKAAALQSAACDLGDALACSSLGDMYFKGGPNFPADPVKGRAAYDKGCAGSDHYAAGVCGSIGDMLAKGQFGAAPRRSEAEERLPAREASRTRRTEETAPSTKAAMPYLKKSCAQGYRCDLYVEFLLRDGRDAEAIEAFDGPKNFFMRDEWAAKYCSEGFKVMCGHTAPKRISSTTSSSSASKDSPGY